MVGEEDDKRKKFSPQGSSPFMKNVKVQMEVQNFTHINGDVEGSGTGNRLLKSPATGELTFH